MRDGLLDPAHDEGRQPWPGAASQRRILGLYGAARVLVAAALVGVQWLGPGFGLFMSSSAGLVVWAYAAQAVGIWMLPPVRKLILPDQRDKGLQARWLLTIGVDLLAFFTLHVLHADVVSSYTALLVLPVLMAGVLTSRVLALGTAASVSLMLLAVGWRASLVSPEGLALVAQQGFTSIGFFAIALLTSELTGRLLREEQAAADSLEMARRQAGLNRLVLDEMAEGVLVVDRRLRVRAANPAARLLISGGEMAPAPPFALTQQACWGVLAQGIESALAGEPWPEAGRVLELRFPEGIRRALIVRMRFSRSTSGGAAGPLDAAEGEDHCVLFLEDVRTVEARARQDKLAAMGRMSAGIAHEIRNPLAAIAQANQLLAEDAATPQQQRLAGMVADNVRRLQRIVEDVLATVSAPTVRGESCVDARSEVVGIVSDWAASCGVAMAEGGLVRLDLPAGELPVEFDAEHLRRVLVNLLDNARRHGSGAAGSIQLRLAVRDETSAVIALASDGEPIPPAVERHLFEPFFSTRSRGSGLGLYICRELCERNGASIEFRAKAPDQRHRNAFVIVIRRAGTAATGEVAPP
jgi:two-component system sensor histidine kinase PilS (NtrC family)